MQGEGAGGGLGSLLCRKNCIHSFCVNVILVLDYQHWLFCPCFLRVVNDKLPENSFSVSSAQSFRAA